MVGTRTDFNHQINQGSTTFNVERDLIIAKNYMGRKTDFYPPKLDLFRPPIFPRLLITEPLTNRLCQQHLLVLGGTPEVEKDDIARHLAWSLHQQKKLSGEDIAVQEWEQPTDFTRLILNIQEEKLSTIFILPNAEPRHLGFELYRLQQLLGDHFIVASTEIPEQGWKNSGGFNPACWYELTVKGTYNAEWLAEIFLNRLEDTVEQVPEIFQNINDPNQTVYQHHTIVSIAATLRTPGKIDTFLQLLYQEKNRFEPSRISILLEHAENVQPVLEHWFLHSLSPQEQNLVMGLTLLDGLFDGQFFNALERVANSAWRPLDPHFLFPDYKDLEKLSNFYLKIQSGEYGFKLESGLPGQRKTMLRVLLKYRRRQLLHALNVLVDLVVESVQDRSVDINLYSTKAHRDQIRRAVTDTLSDIDLVAGTEVEACLLRLAADEDSDVQAVAAEALARKVGEEGSDALIKTFERWQHDDRILKWIERFTTKRENGPEAHVFVKATLALAMAFASQYQPRNRISRREVDFFRKLAKDSTPLVRDRFRKAVLQKMVPQHLKHLRRVLRELLDITDLIGDISLSLALAYPVNSEEVVNTLNQWYEECRMKYPPASFYETLGAREKLLLTIIFTHGFIQYNQAASSLSIEATLERFKEILDKESNRLVRTAVFQSVLILASQDFDKVRPGLAFLVAQIDLIERHEFTDILLEIYLAERAQFRGGDEVVKIKQQRFSIYYDPSNYPVTDIEKLMFEWMHNRSNAAAGQVAIEACLKFDRYFLRYEDYRIPDQSRNGTQPSTSQSLPSNTTERFLKTVFRKSQLIERIASWLFTREVKEYRPILQNLLPEAMIHYRGNREEMKAVLARWDRVNNPNANRISALLKPSVDFVTHSLLIWLVSILILTIVIYLLIQVTHAILVIFAGY